MEKFEDKKIVCKDCGMEKFEDKKIVCKDCGKEFICSAGEQEFLASKGFDNLPKRCIDCRRAFKAQRNGRR